MVLENDKSPSSPLLGEEERGREEKKEEELNAKEEEELPVRWSWLGEVEEEVKFVGT